MDFASQLANLERTANAASRRRNRGPEHQQSQQQRNQRPRHHQQYGGPPPAGPARPLAAMERFGYRLYPPPPPPPRTEHKIPHICLLAITIDDLPYEHIWRAWADDHETRPCCYVSLVGHAKFPERVQSDWLKQRLLLQPPRMGRGNKYDDPVFYTHKPEWGSIEIARAMRDCLRDAVKIGGGVEAAVGDERFSSDRYIVAKPEESNNNEDQVKTSEESNNATEKVKEDEKKKSTVPPVDKFIFISETCLPVRTLSECVQALFFPNDHEKEEETKTQADGTKSTEAKTDTSIADPWWDVSWVNARNRNTPGTPKNKYERDQFGNIHRMVPGMHRWKADQWLVLSRRHALAVLHMDAHMSAENEFWNAFANINASDEMYFPTALSVLGILKEDKNSDMSGGAGGAEKTEPTGKSEQEGDSGAKTELAVQKNAVVWSPVAKRAVTYTDWSEGMRNPALFTGGQRDLIRVGKLARKQGCLFARKFAPQSDGPALVTGQISVDEWKEAIEMLNKDE